MLVRILRFNPEADREAIYQEYTVPITHSDRNTVMDVLKYIYDHIDSSLSFFSHSVCNHGICGRCAMKINGKVRLACTYLVEEEIITIEPKNNNVIKDLVTK